MADYGLKQVHNDDKAALDIVFLHGLRGHVTETWTKEGVLWPKDLLPKTIPNSRIFLFGYDSSIVYGDQSNVSKTEIYNDAEDLCAKLAAERAATNTTSRPIVLVAHSLGGLVAAQTFVLGERRPETLDAREITKNLRGMVFLGTPFQGSSSAKLAETARRILELFGVDTQENTLKLLGVDSEQIRELNRAFAEFLSKRNSSADHKERVYTSCFYETLKTGKFGLNLVQVVERDSATLPGWSDSAPIRTDHLNICKFKTDQDEGYAVVAAAILKSITSKDEPLKEATRNLINNGKVAYLAQGDITVSSGVQHINL